MEIYRLRMKIEESFCDMKDLLNIDKIMNYKRDNMEKMISMVLLSYLIALLIGEGIREVGYAGKKRKLYSGLFILLYGLSIRFGRIALGNVRTYVLSSDHSPLTIFCHQNILMSNLLRS